MQQIISSQAAMDIYQAAFMMGILCTIFWRSGSAVVNLLLDFFLQKRK
jgi:hypothetical protein